METVRLEPIRNVAIVSSAGAGKTSLSEALLYVGGAIPMLGSVTQGTTVSDFEPEELRHRNSTSTSLLQFSWNHTNINLIDPPGALDLLGEPLAALQAVDAAILLLSGNTGVRTELARLWGRIKELDLPCLVFVNGLDKEGASFENALETCRQQFGRIPIPMTLPITIGAHLDGIIDVRHEKVVRSGPSSAQVEHVQISNDLEGILSGARKQLVEAVAESG
ncbi:MAG TPA: GTP-binding protein, partial [Nitrospira sp.]|nr:GTP-binding protein [Nitrospira sp.]